MFQKWFMAFLIGALLQTTCALAQSGPQFSASDQEYLRQIMRETWDYIDFFRAKQTGYPFDSQKKTDITNTTNIGLYLACLSVAHRLGYISTLEAESRIRPILDSLARTDSWNNLYNNWLDPYGSTAAKPGANNISDYNKLPAGIMLVRQEFPRFGEECSRFLDGLDWSVFYEPQGDKIRYEFDIVKKTTQNPLWISKGEDKLLGVFLAIASGKVPAKVWDQLDELEDSRYGLRYYMPGWQGGGLFMQYICSIFIDTRGTNIGRSAANFAAAQILHAKALGLPAWGWSACVSPDDVYLGWGRIRDNIVTPHASALAIGYFPLQAVATLRALEKLGARAPYVMGEYEYDFGFRDSVDLKFNRVAEGYLVLDQAMLFLSLANAVENDMVHTMFMADPIAKAGVALIPELRPTQQQQSEFKLYISSLQAGAY
jgi:hypothetical protein